MAHRSFPSPDGKWVILSEMTDRGEWLPCRVVLMDGTFTRQADRTSRRRVLVRSRGRLMANGCTPMPTLEERSAATDAYRVRPDGSALIKASDYPVIATNGISQDGKWLVVYARYTRPGQEPEGATMAFPLLVGRAFASSVPAA